MEQAFMPSEIPPAVLASKHLATAVNITVYALVGADGRCFRRV